MKRKLGIFLAVIMLFASIAFAGCDWFEKKELKNATYIQTSFKVYASGGELVGEQSYNQEEALSHGDGIIFDTNNLKLRLFQNNEVELAEECEYTVEGVNFQFRSNIFGDIQGKVIGKNKIELTINDDHNNQVHYAVFENLEKEAYSLYTGKYETTKFYDGQGVEQSSVKYFFDFNDEFTQLNQYNSDNNLIGTYNVTRGFNTITYNDSGLTIKVTLNSNNNLTAKAYDANGDLQATVLLTIKPENSGADN